MNEVFSWKRLFDAITERRKLFFGILAGCFLIAAIYTRIAPREYEAAAMVTPQMTSLVNTGNTSLSGLGGGIVSSLLNGASTVPPSFDRFMNLVSSVSLADAVLRDDKIKEGLFPDQWDARNHKWHAPGGIGAKIKQGIRWSLGFPAWQPPDAGALAIYLGDNINFVNFTRSQIYQMTYRNKNRAFARYLLQVVSSQLDQRLKQHYINTEKEHIQYIDSVLQKETAAELRTAMAELYLQEQQRLMLASSGQPFSADFVDPVAVGDAPVTPRLPVVFGAAAFFGFCFAILGVLFLPRTPSWSASGLKRTASPLQSPSNIGTRSSVPR
jgi:hypothetical protein